MHSFLQELIVGQVFAFLLIFMRFGMVVMLMPGIGDGFVPPQIRLLFALAFSFILTPALSANLPAIPRDTGALIGLLASEAFIGIFIGVVMRIIVSALDTAGTIVSAQTGFSNAMMLNPSTETQAPIMSAVYSSLGVTVLMVSDLHHHMLAAIVDSYQLYPAAASLPDMGSFSLLIGKVVTLAFRIGVQIALPFLVVGTLLQMGFGILGRLMPQLQIFFLAMPLQIFLSMIILVMTLSVGILYWLHGYESVLIQTLTTR